jgi:hypothetical protein
MAKVTPKKKAVTPAAKGSKASSPAKETKEVARRNTTQAPGETTELAKPMAIDEMLLQDFGSGTENMTMASYAIPRIVILQALSPAVIKGNPGQVEGAEVGMLMENVSQTLWEGETGFLFLPISYRLTYINWWPRNPVSGFPASGGKGFIADLGPDPKVMERTKKGPKGEAMLPNGSEIVLTAEYFGYIIDESGADDPMPVLVSMAKTQFKKSKALNTLTRIMISAGGKQGPAPLFYCTYRLTVGPETNAANQTYMNWQVERGPALLEGAKQFISPEPEILEGGEALYVAARAFKQRVDKGEVKVAAPTEDHVPAGGGGQAGNDDAPM